MDNIKIYHWKFHCLSHAVTGIEESIVAVPTESVTELIFIWTGSIDWEGKLET